MVHIVRTSETDWVESKSGDKFHAWRKGLTPRAGAPRLGCSLYRLPPGKRAFPRHYHMANDEAVFVLAGRGEIVVGEERYELGPGDYVHLPAASEQPHQVVNSSDEPLDYLCMSSMIEPEVAVYPDSGKVGVIAGSAPGGPKDRRSIFTFLSNEPVDYWDGEA